MSYNISSEVLYAAACLIFIISGIFCSFVRWRHMCHPYDQYKEYFYPSQRLVTFFYLATSLQFPYLLNPTDQAIWTYVRCFGIIYYPVCFSIMFRTYFKKEHLKKNRRIILYFATPFVLIGIMLLHLAINRASLLSTYTNWLMPVMGATSILLTLNYISIARWIKKCIDNVNKEGYSNEEDFPYTFAKKVFYTPLLWTACMWVIFITGSHWAKFVLDILLSMWMVIFLTMILHPQQFCSSAAQKERLNQTNEHISTLVKDFMNKNADTFPDNNSSSKNHAVTSVATKKEVLQILLENYKNPHLSKSEILERLPFGMKSEADAFIASIGYYNLVNMFRLTHARLCKEANPSATQENIAVQSGFNSRYALYRAQKSVEYINPELVSGVKLDGAP